MRFAACLTLVALLSPNVGAVDKNLLSPPENIDVCERFLSADLSGVYVATFVGLHRSNLLELRPIGPSGVYTISATRLNLGRELEVERLHSGWALAAKQDATVNLLSLDRQGDASVMNFRNASEPGDDVYSAAVEPYNPRRVGNALSPDGFAFRLEKPVLDNVVFTRLEFNRAFELAVSRSLKSLLATRLHDEGPGEHDYAITVEFRTPVTVAEAARLLSLEESGFIPLNVDDSGYRHYRYATSLAVYGFLEHVGPWLRGGQVVHVDVLPRRSR